MLNNTDGFCVKGVCHQKSKSEILVSKIAEKTGQSSVKIMIENIEHYSLHGYYRC